MPTIKILSFTVLQLVFRRPIYMYDIQHWNKWPVLSQTQKSFFPAIAVGW